MKDLKFKIYKKNKIYKEWSEIFYLNSFYNFLFSDLFFSYLFHGNKNENNSFFINVAKIRINLSFQNNQDKLDSVRWLWHWTGVKPELYIVERKYTEDLVIAESLLNGLFLIRFITQLLLKIIPKLRSKKVPVPSRFSTGNIVYLYLREVNVYSKIGAALNLYHWNFPVQVHFLTPFSLSYHKFFWTLIGLRIQKQKL